MNKLVSIVLAFTSIVVYGQEEQRVKCHTYEMTEKLLQEHPEIAHTIEEAEKELDKTRRKPNLPKDGDVYTIPVVFHIIHNYGSENISFEQIQNAIDVMNEDFSATNSNVGSVNAAFQDLVANVKIQFALAQRDPEGNCTNGVVRTASILTTEGGENLKEISPIWDRSRYMNIWVCRDIASGAAGYTYYPSTLAGSFGETNDGIVVRSDYVGAIGTSNFTRSMTLTHEVGHWIDLPHLWGSTNQPEEESNCNTDDGVADTPNTIGWTSCISNGESCGSLDNVENYMEYSFCGKMFTLGQAERMRNAIESSVAERSSLWQAENLEFTGVDLDPELCQADFTANKRVVCLGEPVEFSDLSFSAVTERTWIFEGGEPAGSIEANPIVSFTEPGTYAVSILVSDGINELSVVRNDYIRVLDTAYTVLPFSEGFEELEEFNQNDNDVWYTDNYNGEIDWEVTDLAAYSGEKSVYVNGFENGSDEVEFLYSQTFDLTELSENALLSFKYSCARRNFSSDDMLRVWITKNCGDHWSIRKTLDGDDLYTVNGNFAQPFIPNGQDDWNEVIIDNISPTFFEPDFRVRFEFISSNGNNIFIDDINLIDGTILSSNDLMKVEKSVNIFPNPSNGLSFVELSLPSGQKQMDVQILDISGRSLKPIYQGTMPEGFNRIELNTNDLASGIYMLQFTSESGAFIKRFIKNEY